MGYRSDYDLTLTPQQGVRLPSREDFQRKFRTVTGYSLEIDPPITTPEVEEMIYTARLTEAKWYDCEPDMEILSSVYRDIRFEVHITGEDQHQWIVDAINGRIECRHGEMTFPPRTLWDENGVELPPETVTPEGNHDL